MLSDPRFSLRTLRAQYACKNADCCRKRWRDLNPHPPGPYHVRARNMDSRKPGALSIELHRYSLACRLDL